MNKTIFSVLLTVILATGAVVGVSYALKGGLQTETSPKEVVKSFYQDWISYQGGPIADKIYRNSPWAADELAEKIDGIIASFDHGGYDPVLCAQDFPKSLQVKEPAIDGDKASVIVSEDFYGNNRNVLVELSRQSGDWKITNIVCQEGELGYQSGDAPMISPAIANLVGDYIRENISALSPEPEVLGGKFYIVSINFTGPYEAIVEYEDGHNLYRAKAVFSVPASQEVKIESFDIIMES